MASKIRINIKSSMSKSQIKNEVNRGMKKLEQQLVNDLKRKLQ
ncbi:hypothetical protein [Cohnella sp. WQ 127256]|nr:hypothetical protein [Cohnella sp. WQ 127256]